MNISDYLTLNTDRLAGLPLADRFAVLGEIAAGAGAWVSAQRAQLVEDARDAGATDGELAEELGVARQNLARLGDGPRTRGIKPRLLREGARLLLEHHELSQGSLHGITTALSILDKRGQLSQSELWSAAQRIMMCAKNLPRISPDLTAEDRDTLTRAIGHATQVASNAGLSQRD